MKKIILFIKQLLCKHKWSYTSINYYDNKGRLCVDVECKLCHKRKTSKL